MKNKFNKLDAFKTIEESWNIFKGNFKGPVLVCLIPIAVWIIFQIINFFLGNINTLVKNIEHHNGSIYKILIPFIITHGLYFIITNVINLIINISVLDYFIRFLRKYKEQNVNFKFVFDIRLLHIFLYNILYVIFIFIVSMTILIPIIGLMVFTAKSLSIPAIILIILPVILLYFLVILYITLTLYLSIYFIIDKKYTCIEAFSASIAATKKNKLQLLILMIIMPILGITVTICTLGIGFLPFLSFIYIVYVKAYLNIVDAKDESTDENQLSTQDNDEIITTEII